MEFKLLKFFNNHKIIEKKIDPKYDKILNNLLGILRFDDAIFTKEKDLIKDLNKILNQDDITKIYTKFNFKIKVRKISIDIKNKIQNSNNPSEIIELIENLDFKINAKIKKQLFSSFEISKKEVIKKIEENENTFLVKWKKYQKTINDDFRQTSIWPLFIGTYFIKGIISKKAIYAPLVLKEINIEIIGNDVYLISKNDSLIINDKLAFLLEESSKIVVPVIDLDSDKITFEEFEKKLDHFFKNILNIGNEKLLDNFEDLNVQDVVNKKITKTSGILLLNCHPAGGSLRKATQNIIDSGKINSLLQIDNVLSDFHKESIKNLIEKDIPIARVCQTDPSQEKAILASLKEHAIIIGPPGTGKSQTIANLLANILVENKTALFISQKRVALEVVIERMGDLQYFMLQLVEKVNKTNADEKKDFYSRLQKFINYAKGEKTNLKTSKFNPLINKNMKDYWMYKDSCQNISQREIDLFCQIRKKITNYNYNVFQLNKVIKILSKIKSINPQSDIEKMVTYKNLNLKEFAQKMDVEPRKIFGFLNFYENSFKKTFKLNLNLINFLKKAEADSSIFNDLKKIKSINKIEKLWKFYPFFVNKLKPTNNFSKDNSIILESLQNNAKEKLKLIQDRKNLSDKTWLGKFKGQIERGYTVPHTFINLFKKELKEIFNIVVSTPESLSNFVDFKNDRFDYVIFDEASQIFLEKAIPFISLGKKVIIAGDNQQMQPSNWFSKRSDNDDPENELENIDSLLDYATFKGIPKYNLELNYRSMYAALTTFSSKEFYHSDLKTLDQNGTNAQSIEIININGVWKNQTNLLEAQKMVELLKHNFHKYSKIILLTLNKSQMNLVNDILASQETKIYDAIISGEVILKNIENIQGDEADLVIISIAYTKDAHISSTYVGRKGGRNALNVAITRAKEKIIILKSLVSSDIKINNDASLDLSIFKKWIIFLELTEKQQKEYSIIENKNNVLLKSNFENRVYQWLKEQTFHQEIELHTQYLIGSYRIGIAIIDKISQKFLVGIEIDSFKYYPSLIQKYDDIIRQNFIESKGYKLIIISELLWKTNQNKILNMIKENLVL